MVTGGTVEGKSENIALKNDSNGKITVTGGTIKANCQAIENESSSGIITIGVDDGVVSTTSPEVIAPNNYLAAWGGTVNYYDGILKGAGISTEYSTVIHVPSGYTYYRDDSKNPYETTLRKN